MRKEERKESGEVTPRRDPGQAYSAEVASATKAGSPVGPDLIEQMTRLYHAPDGDARAPRIIEDMVGRYRDARERKGQFDPARDARSMVSEMDEEALDLNNYSFMDEAQLVAQEPEVWNATRGDAVVIRNLAFELVKMIRELAFKRAMIRAEMAPKAPEPKSENKIGDFHHNDTTGTKK
jgi:hypothetical protein